ncbi:MAG TPA: uracil-DNA glycosylase [Bacillota bacterium]|jgi:uracil-DNA glycosylase|nr:uracil-DNA glycosylase [Bacillota bacterium]HOL10209.1 uracil-DNA glycosylase [Bacillota bacterium]HPO97211.1 uracil-DNA glycosylase [Bacillota bacterium]
MGVIFKNDWQELLESELQKEYYLKLRRFLALEYQTKTIYPDKYDIFNALHYTAYNDTKVVILGQDPYHGPRQAHGLSFSVKPGVEPPPSLINIFKELKNDLGCYIPNNGYLKKWADQGVLLLNTVLTVEAGKANSHRNKGWEQFTDRIVSLLNERQKPIVFILWGSNAQSKTSIITNPNHYIIKSPHPSPLSASRGFFNSKPFSKVNLLLKSIGEEPIDWQIENI